MPTLSFIFPSLFHLYQSLQRKPSFAVIQWSFVDQISAVEVITTWSTCLAEGNKRTIVCFEQSWYLEAGISFSMWSKWDWGDVLCFVPNIEWQFPCWSWALLVDSRLILLEKKETDPLIAAYVKIRIVGFLHSIAFPAYSHYTVSEFHPLHRSNLHSYIAIRLVFWPHLYRIDSLSALAPLPHSRNSDNSRRRGALVHVFSHSHNNQQQPDKHDSYYWNIDNL